MDSKWLKKRVTTSREIIKKQIALKSCNYFMFNNIQINQQSKTNGRQLIRAEEGTDYVADWMEYLKTEDKEDTDFLRNKQLDGI